MVLIINTSTVPAQDLCTKRCHLRPQCELQWQCGAVQRKGSRQSSQHKLLKIFIKLLGTISAGCVEEGRREGECLMRPNCTKSKYTHAPKYPHFIKTPAKSEVNLTNRFHTMQGTDCYTDRQTEIPYFCRRMSNYGNLSY